MKLRLLTSLAAICTASALQAASDEPVARAALLPGWTTEAGTAMAGLHIELAPGWKTYWRAPGDAGIPPSFDWSASRGVMGVTPHFPRPGVFWQNGMRSIGYEDDVVIPLEVRTSGKVPVLAGTVEIGVCQEICIPYSFEVESVVGTASAANPAILVALADRPHDADQLGLTRATCAVEPISDGLRVTASLDLPALGDAEVAVMEAGDPAIWVSDAETQRAGGQLTITAEMVPPSGAPFALDRSGVRITVLSDTRAAEVTGCTAAR